MDDEAILSWAEGRHRAGDLAGAETGYRAVLKRSPAKDRAWFLLGVVCQAAGRVEEAVDALWRSLELREDQAAAWNVLGAALGQLGRPADAEVCFVRALRIQPDHAEAAANLERARRERNGDAVEPAGMGFSLEECCRRAHETCTRGRYAEGETWLRRAVALQPRSGDLLSDLGKVLVLQSRQEEAVPYLRQAVSVDPSNARAHLNLAATLFELDRLDEAAAAARSAVALEPGNPSARNNLGLILAQLGRLSGAESSYRAGLDVEPDHPELHANLANVLVLQGRAPEAQAHYGRALARKPESPSLRSNALLSLHYLPDVGPAELLEAHREWDRRHGAPLRSHWRPFANDPDPDRPLRLGFVSGDFQRHPVGYFAVRPIEELRKLGCEIYCYHSGSGNDDLTRRFAEASTAWRPCRGLFDDELAEQIRADRIDLLFDLAGHTSRNRLMVFARKPAPIQLTWIGYEGTTGLSAIDHLVADRYQVPRGTESFFTEKVLRLPSKYLCFDPPADAPEVGPPPCLKTDCVTFGCFNNPAKIGRDVVATWAGILRGVPRSRLYLKYRGLDDEMVRRRFLGLFESHGIEPARVRIEGWSPLPEMLAAYHHVDIALDPFPFSGCLTTCLALWMGVPVVTRAGETFAGRHTVNIMSAIGMRSGFITLDTAGYTKAAVVLASIPSYLERVRSDLRRLMATSALCDGRTFAADLLRLLRECWRDWCTSARSADGS